MTAALRVMGLSDERHFQTYHRVLNRALWSSLKVSRILLGILVQAFAAMGTIVLGLDDTIERRRGAKIKARGIYRDPVRSSHGHFVKAGGLRWLSVMLLAPIPWAHKALGAALSDHTGPLGTLLPGMCTWTQEADELARQALLQVRRWLPNGDWLWLPTTSVR